RTRDGSEMAPCGSTDWRDHVPSHHPAPKGGAMEPPTTGHDDIGHDEPSVHNWRVFQLKRLGIPASLAAMSVSAWEMLNITTGIVSRLGSVFGSASTSRPLRRGKLSSSRIRPGLGAPVTSP